MRLRMNAGSLVLAALATLAGSQSVLAAQNAEQGAASQPPPVPSAAPKDPSPTERREMVARFLGDAELGRADFLRALTTLGPEVAQIAADSIFREYAQAVAAARVAAMDALYRKVGDDVEILALSPAELVALARRTSDAYVTATSAAAKQLAEGGADATRSAAVVEADLLRVLTARAYRHALSPDAVWPGPGYDSLLDFDLARATDSGIAVSAAAAESNPGARAGLDTAIAEFREQGAVLARAIVARAGASATVTRTRWGGEAEPPELTKMLNQTKESPGRWRDTNDALAAAIEQFVLAGGDAQAAARWRLRSLAATAGMSIVVHSWGQTVVDAALLLGVSEEELGALRAAVDEATVERAERMKATLAAHRRWMAELKRDGVSPRGAQPSAGLVAAHERQMALELRLRNRVLEIVASPLVREELATIPSPAESFRAPHWLRSIKDQPQDAVPPEQGGAEKGEAPR